MFIILCITILSVLPASHLNHYVITEPYVYPCRPGTVEWSQFVDFGEMLTACDIPRNTLTYLSTHALLETILDHPLLNTVFSYNDIKLGFSFFCKNFNGIPEYLNRPDAATVLIEAYQELLAQYTSSTETEARYQMTYKIEFLKLLSACQQIQDRLTDDDRKALELILNR